MFRTNHQWRSLSMVTIASYLLCSAAPAVVAESSADNAVSSADSNLSAPSLPAAHHPVESLLKIRQERVKKLKSRLADTKSSNEAPETLKPQAERPTIGLALGGGGTRGAAHVGILKVLVEEGIPIDCIVGTSMGAIIGGLYSAGVPIATLEKTMANASLMRAFMTVPLWVRIVAAPLLFTPRLVGFHPYDGLYYGNRFRKFLAKMTPACEAEVQELNIPFNAVAVDITDGKHYSLKTGSLAYALQASSAVPVLRKPVPIGDHLFVDGGVVANVPVTEAKAMGPDIVIAVDVDERVDKLPMEKFRKAGSVSKRMVLLQLAEIDAPQITMADLVIHPQVDGIGLISTKKSDGRRAIKAGEEAARAALPAIRAKIASFSGANAPLSQAQ
jgi:NTE family protein